MRRRYYNHASRASVHLLIVILAFVGLPHRACSDDAGFRPLFNGNDLTGWVKQGPADFEVKDETLVCNGSGNYSTWLRTEEVFENFVLRLEYRNLWDAEGGVFFSAPLHGRIARVGFDVRIANNLGPIRDYSPGAIFEAVPPLVEAARPPVYSDVPSDWNKLEIVMDWPKLKVTLNGKVVQDLNVEEHDSLRYRPRFGYIGLQDRGKPILFRNIEIKQLPDKQRGHWRPLCKGKDLQGWTISDKCSAQWSIENGEIIAKDGQGYLVTDQQFRNCEFQTYVRSSPLANSGVFFRWKGDGDRGFEIQIEDIPDSQDPTGSIYGLLRAKCMPFQPGEWYLMQVFLKDRRCAVRVNGETVAETDALPVDRSGHISLQMHTDRGWVRFKDPRVRPLDKDTAVSQARY